MQEFIDAMKANVLVVEDVQELADLVVLYLGKEGMQTKHALSAEDALKIIETWEVDLIVLDINLPGMDGFEFLSLFRKKSSCPVLIVSARTEDEDVIAGLGFGADEYVTKPFSPRVLSARVRALLRRAQESAQGVAHAEDPEETIRFGPYSLSLFSCVLKRGAERVPLSAKEFEVLSYLAKNPGKPHSPEDVYNAVWKNAYGDLTTVAVYVQRLRKKIEDDPSAPRYIETVFGMGYRFCQPEDTAP